MLEFCVLSSGSKANCLYVKGGETQVLVDCGLSARETSKRLRLINVEPAEIHAVVVSHEHRDHIAGIPNFHRSYHSEIFANEATYEASEHLNLLPPEYRKLFCTGVSFQIGSLIFEPFSVVHDAADPVAFRITNGEYTLAVVTDLGIVTSLVRERTRDLDAIILESNHDPLLLRECQYPWELKQRIAGRDGHLSNETAGALLQHIHQETTRDLKFVVAAHISENSNDPVLALEVLRGAWAQKALRPEPEFVAANAYTDRKSTRLNSSH